MAKKDAYYFPHFCNARHDRKLKRIQKDLGLEGYGIFFMLLEVLREQTDFRYPFADVDLLADEFGTSTAKVEAVINLYDLFTIDQDQNFFSSKLVFYLEPYLEMKEQRRLAGLKSGEARRLKAENKRMLNGSSTDVKREMNENEQSKREESKREESKTTTSEPPEIYTDPYQHFFETNFCQMIPPVFYARIKEFESKGISEEVILIAMEKGLGTDKPTEYIKGTLDKFLTAGIKTMEDFEKAKVEFEKKKQSKATSSTSNKPAFENFNARDLSDEDTDVFYTKF